MKRAFFFAVLFLFPSLFLQAGISGSYHVSGFSPYTNHTYSGIITIGKQGEVYTALWTFNDGSHEIGTGVRKDDQLSFVFQGLEDPTHDLGVQVYQIKHDRLKGPWAFFGGDREGTETLKKIEDECSHS